MRLVNQRLTILVDVDDVINNLCECWCDWLNEHYGTSVTYRDVTEWNIVKFFPELSEEQVFEPLRTPDFWDKVQPKEGAFEYMQKLKDQGHTIYLCTATDYRNIQLKYEKVIQRYFPFIKWTSMIVAYVKQMIKADVLIDDYEENLLGGDFAKLLMDAPHNRSVNATEQGFHRDHDWKEIYETIQTLDSLSHWKG